MLVTALVAVGVATGWKAEAGGRGIAHPLEVPYAVRDPEFRHTLGHLLGAPFVEGNQVETLINGDQVFPAMLEAIRNAQSTITLENFIWSSGRLSRQFTQALSERARAGVRVHVLTDCVGSIRLSGKEIRTMKRAGVEFVRFNEPRWWLNPLRVNHRTHRKIMVVDGRTGFIGGICISDKWTGNAEAPPLWRDNHFRVQGPVVAQLQAIFCENWMEQTGRLLQGPSYFPAIPPAGSLAAHAFMSGPTDGSEHARLAHLYAFAAARESIRIAHSYFIPDQVMVEQLIQARRRGVRVEVVVPGNVGPNVVQRAARSTWRRLLEEGIEFHTYQRSYYHCKGVIVDGYFVSTGSVNIDHRSFRINDEANLQVLDPDFAREQIRVFEEDMANSRRLTAEAFRNRPWYTKLCEHMAGWFRRLM